MTQTGILLTTLVCMLAGQAGYFVGYVLDPMKPIRVTYTMVIDLAVINAIGRQSKTLQTFIAKELREPTNAK